MNVCLGTVLLTYSAFLFFTMHEALQVLTHFSLAIMCVSCTMLVYACIYIYIYIYIYTRTYILAYISLCLCIVGDSGLDLQCLVYFWMREAFVNLKHFSLGIFMHLCHVCEDTIMGVNKKE